MRRSYSGPTAMMILLGIEQQYGSAFGQDNSKKLKDRRTNFIRTKKNEKGEKIQVLVKRTLRESQPQASLTGAFIKHASNTNEHFLCGKPQGWTKADIVAPAHTKITCNKCQRELNSLGMPGHVNSYVPL